MKTKSEFDRAWKQETTTEMFCGLFELNRDEFDSIQFEKLPVNDGTIDCFTVKLKDTRDSCPVCGCHYPKIHASSSKTVNYNILNGRRCRVIIIGRRYKCPNCGRTYTQKDPFCFKQEKIAKEVVINVLRDLKSPTETFSSVSRRYEISVSTVVGIFDKHVSLARKQLAEYMSIDENYAFRYGKSKYVCILMDFFTQEPIDILPDRFKNNLEHYFKSIPWEERAKVKGICIDMYPNYRAVIKECFPESTRIVTDKFHLIKEFNTQADAVRKSLQADASKKRSSLYVQIRKLKEKPDFRSQSIQAEYRILKAEYDEQDDIYYLLKKFNWMFYKNDDGIFDPMETGQYNGHFKSNLNYFQIREKLLSLHPSLSECFRFKGMLNKLYDFRSSQDGKEYFDELVFEMEKSRVKEMRHFASTLKRWKDEILNSLDIVETDIRVGKDGCVTSQDRRLHNGGIERKNKVIKIIKNVANGYMNFERFKTRLLYCLRLDAAFSLEPRYESKAYPKVKRDDR